MAEVALDLQDESGRPPLGVIRPPVEDLPGVGVHTGRRLARAHGAENRYPGKEPPLRQGEPLRSCDLLRIGRVVEFAEHELELCVVRLGRPARQRSAPGPPRAPPRLQPHTPAPRENQPAAERCQAGDRETPQPDRVVGQWIFEGDEVQDRILPEPGEGQDALGPSIGRDASDQREHNTPAQGPAERLQRRHAGVVEAAECHAASAAEKASGELAEDEARREDDAGRSEIVPGPDHGVETRRSRER